MVKYSTIHSLALLTLIMTLWSSNVLAQAPTASPTPSAEPAEFVENEIIVKYKSELTPQELQLAVEERAERQSSFFGSISLFFENLSYQFKKLETPEVKLERLQQADEEAGALNKTRIFDADDEQQRNLFVIETDGSKTVDELVSIYQALPEVEYAEPNYMFESFGVE